MSHLADEIARTIANKHCYENANPIIRCPNTGVNQVTIINRYRDTDNRMRQSTSKAWGCKEHS